MECSREMGRMCGYWLVAGGSSSGVFDTNYMGTGVEPRLMGIGPVAAIPKILAQTGLNKESVDVWEVGTGFSNQATALNHVSASDQ